MPLPSPLHRFSRARRMAGATSISPFCGLMHWPTAGRSTLCAWARPLLITRSGGSRSMPHAWVTRRLNQQGAARASIYIVQSHTVHCTSLKFQACRKKIEKKMQVCTPSCVSTFYSFFDFQVAVVREKSAFQNSNNPVTALK